MAYMEYIVIYALQTMSNIIYVNFHVSFQHGAKKIPISKFNEYHCDYIQAKLCQTLNKYFKFLK